LVARVRREEGSLGRAHETWIVVRDASSADAAADLLDGIRAPETSKPLYSAAWAVETAVMSAEARTGNAVDLTCVGRTSGLQG